MLSLSFQLPVALLLSSVVDATPVGSHLYKRDPHRDVLHGANFPDPSLINVGGVSYVYGTVDGAGNNVPMSSNGDFNNPNRWSGLRDAFPQNNVPAVGDGGWGRPYTTWAPDVNHLTDFDGSFAMYYAAALKSNGGIHCLGLARSLNVQGPYNDSSSQPWICPESEGGAIDAAGFLDSDNKRYVVYKIDGPAVTGGGYCNNPNNPHSNTPLMIQQVGNDGYSKIGGPREIYNNAGEVDSFNVEAPVIVKSSDGWYFLFFSAGCTSNNSYKTDYVTSRSVLGPYDNRQTLIKSGDYGEFAPGGADFDLSGGQMVYHQLQVSNDISHPRVMNTANVRYSGRTATVV